MRKSESELILVAVVPTSAYAARARLFRALEQVFPVQFSGCDSGWMNADAIIAFEAFTDDVRSMPVLVAVPSPARDERPGTVAFADNDTVDRTIRGRSLVDDRGASIRPLRTGLNEEALATVAGRPVWVATRGDNPRRHRVSLEPVLCGDSLRNELRAGRFLSLLPLVHFLREVTSEYAWILPPLRACFVIDDPNLHWPSYGHIRYADLTEHARTHGYHVTMATIPLDSWYTHLGAARIFHDNSDFLSLVMHGNDHVRAELARDLTDRQVDAMTAQAIRRVEALERRAGVHIGRVMVPPHGACSTNVVRGLGRFEVEAVCVSDVYASSARPVLAGWHPADVVAGVPVIPRHHLDASREEMLVRAFLRQPLVLYGHHEDVEGGLDVLAAAAEELSGLGDIEWLSPEGIARTNVLSRRDGKVLHVRPFARRAAVEIPEGVTMLMVELPTRGSGDDPPRITVRAASGADARAAPDGDGFAVEPSSTVELRVLPPHMLSARDVPPPPPHPAAVARRLLTETRDRVRPFRRRLGAAAGRSDPPAE